MSQSKGLSESTTQPLQPDKPAISLALKPLSRLEIDALRQKKKSISEHYQKVLAGKV